MVAEAKSGLLRFCRREGGDRFTYGDAHSCLERHGLLMMSLQEWKDEGTAQLKFRNLMGRKCPTLILDDIQAVEDAPKLLAPFKSCIDPVVSRYTFSDGTVYSCTGLTLVLTGTADIAVPFARFFLSARLRCNINSSCRSDRLLLGQRSKSLFV